MRDLMLIYSIAFGQTYSIQTLVEMGKFMVSLVDVLMLSHTMFNMSASNAWNREDFLFKLAVHMFLERFLVLVCVTKLNWKFTFQCVFGASPDYNILPPERSSRTRAWLDFGSEVNIGEI